MVIRIWSAPRCIDKADHLEFSIGRRLRFSLRVSEFNEASVESE
jgi:hypothetical protein